MNKKKKTLKCKKIDEKKRGNVRTVKTNKKFNFRIIPRGKCTLKNMKYISNKLKFLKNSRYSIKTHHHDRKYNTLEKNQYIEIILFDDCNVPCFLQISFQETYNDEKKVLLVNTFNNDTQPKAMAYTDREKQECGKAFYTCLNTEKKLSKGSTSLDNDIINKCRTRIYNDNCNTRHLITTKSNISRKRFSHKKVQGLYLDGDTIKKSVLLNTHQKKIVNIILNKIVPKGKRAFKSATTTFEKSYNFYYNESHGITSEYNNGEYQKTLLNFSNFFKLFNEYPADLYRAINSDILVDDYDNPIPDEKIKHITEFITNLEDKSHQPPPTRVPTPPQGPPVSLDAIEDKSHQPHPTRPLTLPQGTPLSLDAIENSPNDYKVIEVAKNGDCFFLTVIEGVRGLDPLPHGAGTPQITISELTVDYLRNYLAEQVNEDFFNLWINRRDQFLKKKEPKTNDRGEHDQYLYEKRETNWLLKMKTMDQMKRKMKTRDYWADEWAIIQLEKLLNIKMILITKTGDGVKCTPNDLVPDPAYYIITRFSGNHYDLITYNNKRAHRFDDIPQKLKTLYITTCGRFS